MKSYLEFERDIKALEESGRTSIFAPGFYPMIKDELVNKLNLGGQAPL